MSAFLQNNGSAAQYMLILIKYHGLPRCCGTYRCVKGTEHFTVRLFCQSSVFSLMVVTDLRQYSGGLCQIFHCHIIHMIAQHFIRKEFLIGTDDDFIGLGSDGGDKHSFPHRKFQSSALSQCIMGNALMPA